MSDPAGLPETYHLLTRRGDLHIDDVVVGDETLDANGKWVKIEAIHRREDTEVEHWHLPRKNANQAPEFSPEFQAARGQWWLHWQYRDSRPVRYTIEAHDPDRPLPPTTPERYGKKIQFVPRTAGWIAKGLSRTDARTPREQGAAVVAMMESATIECTFHWGQRMLNIWEKPNDSSVVEELLAIIPDEVIVSYEKSYMTWDGRRHLVTLDPTKVANLPGADMLEWVRGLSQREVESFFNTYWYLNGETRFETRDWPYRAKVPVRNYQGNRLRAMQLAAFRAGNLGRPVQTKGKRDEVKIGMVEGRAGAHKYTLKDTYNAPTWSVTTESGTLTVWAPVNSREHAYIITGHERS
jgi:hypothetical protein